MYPNGYRPQLTKEQFDNLRQAELLVNEVLKKPQSDGVARDLGDAAASIREVLVEHPSTPWRNGQVYLRRVKERIEQVRSHGRKQT